MIHIMKYGSPMCCFAEGMPVQWPSENLWVGFNDPEVMKHVSCKRCEDAFRGVAQKTPAVADGVGIRSSADFPPEAPPVCDACYGALTVNGEPCGFCVGPLHPEEAEPDFAAWARYALRFKALAFGEAELAPVLRAAWRHEKP